MSVCMHLCVSVHSIRLHLESISLDLRDSETWCCLDFGSERSKVKVTDTGLESGTEGAVCE